MFSPPSPSVSSSVVMKSGDRFIIFRTSSAVCCFTEAIAGGIAAPDWVASAVFDCAFCLSGKGAAWEIRDSRAPAFGAWTWV